MQAITNARSYKWGDWWIGILRSFLSGGAAAFLTFGGGSLVGVPPKQVWQMVGINFIAMGMYRLGEFLQLHGAPDQANGSATPVPAAATQASGTATQASGTAPVSVPVSVPNPPMPSSKDPVK